MLVDISQQQKERLFFVEFRLYFYGELKRSDLIDRFGIKEAAATRDISQYKALRPENIEYNSRNKIYEIGYSFIPVFEHNSLQVLSGLSKGLGDDYPGVGRSLITCETPIQLNQPKVDTIAVISRAIHNNELVEVNYCSHSSGKSRRVIAPFALVDNGFRWHIRAFDRKRGRFTDFVLTRITKPKLVEGVVEEAELKEQDIQWNRIVQLEIVPHPNLKYPDTTTLDFGMENGVLSVNLRAAVAGYALQRWNVDCSEGHILDHRQHHLWLRNRAALYGVESVDLAPGYNS
ncbi:hypothetical protein WH95_13535 [Kiloniella litopenaei]|uniref:Uncharacterized protein n=1 Tax=Kiloniella litopenaei TaxID=1549748 RepID=A0A0M2R3V8_9PROT|nr:WYL domain-containing protein [Kiloniella litopenaei]KKJ76346.1 hypothetical protein WH95_13535 [Kiloniella litopenaei]